MKPKALVIGGTGFIGKHTTASLIRRCFETHVVSRTHRPEQGHWIAKDRANLTPSGIAWDVVVDNIAYNAKDILSTLSVFPKFELFVLNSTIALYRYCPDHSQPYLEDSIDYSYQPTDENLGDAHWKYAQGKLEAEKALLQSGRKFAILRPTMVFGKNDVTGRTQWYCDRIREGKPLRASEKKFHLVAPEGVGEAFGLIAEKHATGAFNVAGPEFTLKTFLQNLAEALGRTASFDDGVDAGPYSFDKDWTVSTEKLKGLGWKPSPNLFAGL